jgi:hypothetical protein
LKWTRPPREAPFRVDPIRSRQCGAEKTRAGKCRASAAARRRCALDRAEGGRKTEKRKKRPRDIPCERDRQWRRILWLRRRRRAVLRPPALRRECLRDRGVAWRARSKRERGKKTRGATRVIRCATTRVPRPRSARLIWWRTIPTRDRSLRRAENKNENDVQTFLLASARGKRRNGERVMVRPAASST